MCNSLTGRITTFATYSFIVLSAAAPAHAGPPSVSFAKVTGLQPGWVRVTVVYDAPATPTFDLHPTCNGFTLSDSVVGSTALVLTAPKEAFLDLRVDARYLADHHPQRPCEVTALQVQMRLSGTVAATSTISISFPMDVPLSSLLPVYYPLASLPTVTSVPLQRPARTSRYAAYPPRQIGVLSSAGNISFIEVEELPSRGSVGLRGLATFNHGLLSFELGGGAEIFPGWGLDVDRIGITQETTGVQESHPGFDHYDYWGIQPPILSGDATLQILPAPPLFSEATYLADVLDNRAVPRCYEGRCLDLVYNQISHALDAVNGARLLDLDPGPIPDLPSPHPITARAATAYEAQVVRDLDTAVRALESNRQLSPGELQQIESGGNNPQFPVIDLSAKTLVTSAGPGPQSIQATIPQHRALVLVRGMSPQEMNIINSAPSLKGPGSSFPTAACVLNSSYDGVTSPLSRCTGFSKFGFRCPTVSDPLRPEDLPPPPGSARELGLLNVIPPYYASRENDLDTCGTHSFHQYYEALLDRYSDDLAPKRVIYVDGLPITVPTPRVATSVTSGLWELYSWAGTHAGEAIRGSVPWPYHGSKDFFGFDPRVKGMFPLFLDAYWPGRENTWSEWARSSSNSALQACAIQGFWSSGFCIGQGQPPPGVYRNYSRMVTGQPAAADVPWSLGNSYFNVVSHDISLADMDAAIQAVIDELKKGLPVLISFTCLLYTF
jgi:hypothetical protein